MSRLLLAFALTASLAAGVDRAGADGAGKISGAAGGKTVGVRAAQPGTLSRSTQPTILITGAKKVLLTAFFRVETRSTKRTTGCSPPRPAAQTRHWSHTLSIASRKIAALVSSRSSPKGGFHTQHPSAGLYSSFSGHGGGGLPTGDSFMS